ncbi:putative restriction endonuclease [Calidithermus terrae]|uniref:Putative restriction endonuclease n=1 Tax=Calidithermus terrae TaxID=1408545 RepID=A0A399EM24_9DEIN|nr:Uma2 family endonuclease [Calidithermus terrae]RIH84533.1 putative restriction endonuclease [Calidithermus terrae]
MAGIARTLQPVAFNEYLALEEKAQRKHELVDGILYAMAGASERHNLVCTNVSGWFWQAARGKGCRVYASDMKLKVDDRTSYYPDLMVVCQEDPHEYYKEKPCVVVEVLSESTQGTDRREKLQKYLKLPSLQAYLLVDSLAKRVEGYYRKGEQWLYQDIQGEGEFEVPCLGLSLTLEAVYEGTNVPSIDNLEAPR